MDQQALTALTVVSATNALQFNAMQIRLDKEKNCAKISPALNTE